jgi:hypothetical protein
MWMPHSIQQAKQRIKQSNSCQLQKVPRQQNANDLKNRLNSLSQILTNIIFKTGRVRNAGTL